MFIFDAHCDTLSTGRDLMRNSGHFDVTRAAARGAGIQVMAAYGENQLGQLARLRAFTRETALPRGFMLLPAVEGGDTIRDLRDLDAFLQYRPVFFGLTWNHDNALAGGCRGRGGGLTALGRETVRALGRAGVIVDLAHASEKTFWDVMEMPDIAVAVTHAGCHALRPHRRNLTDAQMRALRDRGGVLGIVFYPQFLKSDHKQSPATAADVWRHIEHALAVMGPGGVGLGSDFDGCEELPEGILGTEDVPYFLDQLPVDDDVKTAVAGGNFMRLLESVSRASAGP